MGWKFKWVSSYGNDFNYDFHVSPTNDELVKGRMYYNYEIVEFQCEEQPGISVFYNSTRTRPATSFTPYSSYGRGGDILIGTYNYLDLTPFPRSVAERRRGKGWIGYGITTGTIEKRRKGGLSDSQSCSPIAFLALPLPT